MRSYGDKLGFEFVEFFFFFQGGGQLFFFGFQCSFGGFLFFDFMFQLFVDVKQLIDYFGKFFCMGSDLFFKFLIELDDLVFCFLLCVDINIGVQSVGDFFVVIFQQSVVLGYQVLFFGSRLYIIFIVFNVFVIYEGLEDYFDFILVVVRDEMVYLVFVNCFIGFDFKNFLAFVVE